jgi:hypothetical protein
MGNSHQYFQYNGRLCRFRCIVNSWLLSDELNQKNSPHIILYGGAESFASTIPFISRQGDSKLKSAGENNSTSHMRCHLMTLHTRVTIQVGTESRIQQNMRLFERIDIDGQIYWGSSQRSCCRYEVL